MNLLKLLLFPFGLLFWVVTALRNALFDSGFLKTNSHSIKVISVGNLRVGGSGKTPMVAFLGELLKDSGRVGFLSRGYGRESKGYKDVLETSVEKEVGEESLMLKRKFGDSIDSAVCENRNHGARKLMEKGVEILVLDDAFQHRAIDRDVDLLLSDFNNPFFKDQLLPVGRLRESKSGARRADALIITNCPTDLGEENAKSIGKKFIPYLKKETPIFFASLEDLIPKPIFQAYQVEMKEMVLLSAIANPTNFEETALKRFEIKKHFAFGDHHRFTNSDLQKVIEFARGNGLPILTTEKDMVKLREFSFLREVPIYYLPVKVKFKDFGTNFDSWLKSKLFG